MLAGGLALQGLVTDWHHFGLFGAENSGFNIQWLNIMACSVILWPSCGLSVLSNDSTGRGQDGFRFGVKVPSGQKFIVKKGYNCIFSLVPVNQRRSQNKCWTERICVWRCVLMGEAVELEALQLGSSNHSHILHCYVIQEGCKCVSHWSWCFFIRSTQLAPGKLATNYQFPVVFTRSTTTQSASELPIYPLLWWRFWVFGFTELFAK